MKKFTMFILTYFQRKNQGVKRKGYYIYYGCIEGYAYTLSLKEKKPIISDRSWLKSDEGWGIEYIKLPADLIFGKDKTNKTNYNDIRIKGPLGKVIHIDDGFKKYIKEKYGIIY